MGLLRGARSKAEQRCVHLAIAERQHPLAVIGDREWFHVGDGQAAGREQRVLHEHDRALRRELAGHAVALQILDRFSGRIIGHGHADGDREQDPDETQIRILPALEIEYAIDGIAHVDRVHQAEFDLSAIDQGRVGRRARHGLDAGGHARLLLQYAGNGGPGGIVKRALGIGRNPDHLGVCHRRRAREYGRANHGSERIHSDFPFQSVKRVTGSKFWYHISLTPVA